MKLIGKQEYEEELAGLEKARKLLRVFFVDQQVEQIPELRTLDGYRYKQLDDQLLSQIEVLEHRWKITRFVVSQGKPKESLSTFRQIPALVDQPLSKPIKSTRCPRKGCPYPSRNGGFCTSCSTSRSSSNAFRRDRR